MDRLGRSRNQIFLSGISQAMKQNGEQVFVVGCSHLVGRDNLLQLLEESGFNVSPVQ
ncbi:MAG: TraB/GumN family protein [Betaproteobacteria bacterium]|nr:TraB/GumN family protein [Betaproteobacteria bacterium]